jgi:hypothetical protein
VRIILDRKGTLKNVFLLSFVYYAFIALAFFFNVWVLCFFVGIAEIKKGNY